MIPYESEWTWYLCEVKPGPSRVVLHGAVARSEVKLGAWIWSDRDCRAGQQPLPVPCGEPEMPQHEDLLDRQGVCIFQPER